MGMEGMKKKARFASALRTAFHEADTSGDGVLTVDEFETMMENRVFLETFKDLELEEEDLHALFQIISDDDGVADYEEFLDGAMKMKNTARIFDTVQIMHNELLIRRILADMLQQLARVSSSHLPAQA